MREGEAGQELWCTGMICFSPRKSSLTASASGGGGEGRTEASQQPEEHHTKQAEPWDVTMITCVSCNP